MDFLPAICHTGSTADRWSQTVSAGPGRGCSQSRGTWKNWLSHPKKIFWFVAQCNYRIVSLKTTVV